MSEQKQTGDVSQQGQTAENQPSVPAADQSVQSGGGIDFKAELDRRLQLRSVVEAANSDVDAEAAAEALRAIELPKRQTE